MTKYLQLLTFALSLHFIGSCSAVKVDPVSQGRSLRYHARVGYFLHPPQRINNLYIPNVKKFADESTFKRCLPSSIVRIHSRFSQYYVEIKQGSKTYLFDTIGGEEIKLVDGRYLLVDRYFKKEFPLSTSKVRKMGQLTKKSDLLCQNKVWKGMTKLEFLIIRPPPENILRSRKRKIISETWQYETKKHILKKYIFIDEILQDHNDN